MIEMAMESTDVWTTSNPFSIGSKRTTRQSSGVEYLPPGTPIRIEINGDPSEITLQVSGAKIKVLTGRHRICILGDENTLEVDGSQITFNLEGKRNKLIARGHNTKLYCELNNSVSGELVEFIPNELVGAEVPEPLGLPEPDQVYDDHATVVWSFKALELNEQQQPQYWSSTTNVEARSGSGDAGPSDSKRFKGNGNQQPNAAGITQPGPSGGSDFMGFRFFGLPKGN